MSTPSPSSQSHDAILLNRLIRLPTAIMIRVRRFRLKCLGAHLGRGCTLLKISVPRNPWDIWLDDYVSLDDGVVLLTTGPRTPQPKIVIGRCSYFNRYTMIDATQRIEFGERCMVGPMCYITDSDHGHDPDTPVSVQPMISSPTRIGNGVWIGAGAIILKGVQVGDGAVIAAGAVVTRNVDPMAKVAGVPARVMGSRIPAVPPH